MAEISKKMRRTLENRKKQIKSKSQGLGYIIVKEGTIRARPLPVPPEEEPGLEIIQFYMSRELGGIISPASLGMKCAFYEFWQDASKSKDKGKKAIAAKLQPKSRFMMPVAKYDDLKGKEINERDSPKLILLTGGLYQGCIDLFLDADDWGDFTDPIEGYDLKFARSGTGQYDTEYTVNPCPKTKLPKQFRGKTYDVKEMLKEILPTYEETKEKLEEYLSSLAAVKGSKEEGKKGKLKLRKSKSDL